MDKKQIKIKFMFIVVILITIFVTGCGENKVVEKPLSNYDSSNYLTRGNLKKRSEIQDIVYKDISKIKKTDAPNIHFKEFKFKGLFGVYDYNENYCALMRNTRVEFPNNELYILNLKTGFKKKIRKYPVNKAEKWDILNFKLSNDWVAWEEVSPGEIYWRLYAAKFNSKNLTISKPILIDEGETQTKARPLLDFYENKLAWIVNYHPPAKFKGMLIMMDLDTRKTTVIHTTNTNISRISFSENNVLWTEYYKKNKWNVMLYVYDLKQNKNIMAYDLKNEYDISHFPTHHKDWLSWAVFPNDESVIPNLYLRDPSGKLFLVGPDCNNQCFVGNYMFYRAQKNVAERSKDEIGKDISQIWGINLSTLKKFLLIESDSEKEGVWVTYFGMGYFDKIFVPYANLMFKNEATKIRVYNLDQIH
ncbi:MAG TPA: hypothetical protein ENN38_02980 [Actinobacteria bacterium]|nr:hypothetical protein [Actinomycetota bacterium]